MRRTKQNWLELFKKHEQSGLTASAFCRNEDLNHKYFSTRKIQLLKVKKSVSKEFVKVKLNKPKNDTSGFILSHGKCKLEFDGYPEARWLTEILRSLL